MTAPNSTQALVTERFRQALSKHDHGLLQRWAGKIVTHVAPVDIANGLMNVGESPHLVALARVVLPMVPGDVWEASHMEEARTQMMIGMARYGDQAVLDLARMHIPRHLWPMMAMAGAACHHGNADTTQALMQALPEDTAGAMLAGLRAAKSPMACVRIVLERANPIAITQTLVEGPFHKRLDVMTLLLDALTPEQAGRAAVLLAKGMLGERDKKSVEMVWNRLPEEYRLLSISREHVNLFKLLDPSTWSDPEMDQWVRLSVVHPKTGLAQEPGIRAYIERKSLTNGVGADGTMDVAKPHKM